MGKVKRKQDKRLSARRSVFRGTFNTDNSKHKKAVREPGSQNSHKSFPSKKVK